MGPEDVCDFAFESAASAHCRALAMMRKNLLLFFLCLIVASSMLGPGGFGFVTGSAWQTPLDDYVKAPDPHYSWYDTGKRLTGLLPLQRWEGTVLNMTSQRWLSEADVDCSIWTHDLVIVKPENYQHKKTVMLIAGGGNINGAPPSAYDDTLILGATVAVRTKSLVAILYQVPNQPCHFATEHPRRARSEDALIAYTWSRFLNYPNQLQWPLRLPMTKAVIRAMDTIQSYAADVYNDLVENFVVAGASKRGWATWTTAATDERVVGIIPIVMDALNFLPNIHHFYRALGGWPFAFEPYYEMNLTESLDTPEFKQLMDIVDPFQYKERLTMPKLMITTSNDEFFLIDDSAFFWDNLIGEKHMLILPNTEHTLLTGLPKLLVAVEAFFLSIVEGHELTKTNPARAPSLQTPGGQRSDGLQGRRPGFGGRPKYWWHIDRAAGIIEIGTAENPIKVILWYAYTTKGINRRDFRWLAVDNGNCPTVSINGFCIQPGFFHQRALKPSGLDRGVGTKNYLASITLPQKGYGAFFVELRFAGPKVPRPFIFTTGAVVVPNVFPFEGCQGEDCRGAML